ncbi:MAG: CRISPR-associated DxTHG motif protein [Candidatus Korarchaeum sp.]
MLRGALEGAGCQQLRELEDHVKSFAECVVRCIYKRDAGSLPPFSVVVGPGVGSSGGKWAFKGGVGDFMAKILLELGLLLNELCDERGPTRLVFDLTHGINFMPSGALYLAKMLSSLIILRPTYLGTAGDGHLVNHEISSIRKKCEEKRNAERKCWKYSELTKDSFEGQRPDKRIKIADEVLSPKDSTLTTLRTSR